MSSQPHPLANTDIREFTIYVITNTINGKQYVGITTKPLQKRWREHVRYSSRGSTCHLHRAIEKYGEQCWERHELEKITCTLSVAYEKEVFWIATMGTFERGYNMTAGGDGAIGYKFSDEVRQRMSISRRGRPGTPHTEETKMKIAEKMRGRKKTDAERAKRSSSLKGRKLSEEHKERIRASRIGKKLSAETKKKIGESRRLSYESAGKFTSVPLEVLV